MSKSQLEVILLNAKEMNSWDYLHDHFSHLLGFPDSYCRTIDEWIVYVTYLDQQENRASYNLKPEGFTVIEIFNATDLSPVQNEVLQSLVECTCNVNFRRIELCLKPYIILSYQKQSSR